MVEKCAIDTETFIKITFEPILILQYFHPRFTTLSSFYNFNLSAFYNFVRVRIRNTYPCPHPRFTNTTIPPLL